MHEPDLDQLIAAWKAADASDPAAAPTLLDQIAAACFEAVHADGRALARVHAGEDPDDVAGTGVVVFLEMLVDRLRRWDPARTPVIAGARGGFAGWVTRGLPMWETEVRKRVDLDRLIPVADRADRQMERMYHAARIEFENTHGRTWSLDEARDMLTDHVYSQTRERILARNPDLDEPEADRRTRERVRKDGHLRTLRDLDAIAALADVTNPLSLSAPRRNDPDSEDLGDVLAGVLTDPAVEHPHADRLRELAVFGLPHRQRAEVEAAFADSDREFPAAAVATAHENLTDPLIGYLVLGPVANQFEPDHEPRAESLGDVRDELVRAASLL